MSEREDFLTACAGEDPAAAALALGRFLAANPGGAAVEMAAKRGAEMAERVALPANRLAILSSFTIDPLRPHLAAREFLAGRNLTFLSIPYEQWFTALTAPGDLDDFAPEIVFLLLHLEDVAPLLARRHLARSDQLDGEANRLVAAIDEALTGYRARAATPVVLSTFVAADRGVERYFDRRVTPSRQASIDRLNAQLSDLAARHGNVFILDYAETVRDFGRLAWFDPVKNHHTRTAIAARALPHLAVEMSAFVDAMKGPRRKVLAVDLDNTMWGGIVGEDGVDGLHLSGDYPGNAFADFQAFLANLRASGIALATVSKNNRADAQEVFDTRPDMPLAWNDFTAHRVDWNDKAANLKAIAEEINVGVDSLAYIDDNPMECDLVATYVPEVATIHADGPATLFPRQVLDGGGFYTAALTEEDRGRADAYTAETQRAGLATATDTQGFLAGLDLRLTLRSPRDGEIDRVAQLFGKTNQFNLTTRRHDAAAVMDLCADPGAHVSIARLADRYGDYGLIGIVVTIDGNDGYREIDSLLMSCRILGRNVEQALIAELDSAARHDGRTRLIGHYIATAKNAMVANFYPTHGFAPTGDDGVFSRDLAANPPLPFPDHVKILRETDPS
jgi:FkbH-like protein